MNSWKEFFEKHGQSKVDNRPYASWSEVNIEDLFQAFKARLREEQSVDELIDAKLRGQVFQAQSDVLSRRSPSESEPDELKQIKDKIKTGPR